MLSFINTYPSSNHQWLFLVPTLLITLAWVLNKSLWAELFVFIKQTGNPDKLSAKAKTTNFASVLLFINYLFCGILFLDSFFDSLSVSIYLSIFGILLAIPIFYWFFSLVFSFLTQQKIFFHIYNLHLFYQICVIGLLFFFATIANTYFPNFGFEINIVLISLLAILNLVRLVLGILKAIQLRFSPFYIILYLCTLEILPFIVFYYMFNGSLEGLIVT